MKFEPCDLVILLSMSGVLSVCVSWLEADHWLLFTCLPNSFPLAVLGYTDSQSPLHSCTHHSITTLNTTQLDLGPGSVPAMLGGCQSDCSALEGSAGYP